MDQFKALPLSMKIIFGAGVLLLIDSFFAWQKVSASIGGVEIASAKANAWHGFWGVLMCLLTIALLFWIAAHALELSVPENIPKGASTLAFGIVIFVCALLKNLTDDYSAWASYVGLALAAGVAYGGWLAFQESGESLPSMSKSTPTTAGAGAVAPTAPAATTEPVPPAREPDPPTTPAGSDPA